MVNFKCCKWCLTEEDCEEAKTCLAGETYGQHLIDTEPERDLEKDQVPPNLFHNE